MVRNQFCRKGPGTIQEKEPNISQHHTTTGQVPLGTSRIPDAPKRQNIACKARDITLVLCTMGCSFDTALFSKYNSKYIKWVN